MKGKILKLLREEDGYLSGQDLCQKLGVSRTAVWKVINQLKEEGYEIEAIRNKGYRLTKHADVITSAELESSMQVSWAGKRVEYFEQLDSTNNKAKELAEAGCENGTL
ncbi:MAG: biotin operon repressor, partial [Lachnospiraceae bacterium]